ncbi:hypothetical protein HYFRA_00005324 [Hymenoscyphus fraxineus]|uniref:DUF7708 domain-containing protein n=1 Tax=Hymenoscyphus fraxineus TaxID=746836 RepID=A0A9N9PPR2_9HELO|nr:hypothetical protein HYFRA_00005324 [Hymenoscyphus fraxineus]
MASKGDESLSIQGLAEPSGLSAWKPEKYRSSEAILIEAYDNAVTLYKEKLTKSERKRIWADGKAGIVDIQQALKEAKEKYDNRKSGQSAVQDWLSMFSSRLLYYGGVLEVLAQHHPEYVALAWGSIKFLFVAVLNHEESISRLSAAFALIGDALPHAKLKLELYGNDAMLQAVSQLYAQIMRFSQRAIGWYTESKLKHFYHSVTQPYSLSYKDIVAEVKTCSKRIKQLAEDAAQAEQRAIHVKIERLEQLIISQYGSIVSSGLLNTPFQLRNIEISQVLAYVEKTPLPSPETSLKYHLAMRNRRLLEDPGYLNILNGCEQLNNWASQRSSNLLMIKGTFRTRGKAKHVAASIIASTKQSQVPTVWILAPRTKMSQQLSSLDILKQLVLQILQKNGSLLEDRSQPLIAKQFQCATTESEWFNLLGLVLTGIPEIYIVVDIELLRGNFGDGQMWPSMFVELFQKLVPRSPQTILKVAIIFYLTQLTIEDDGVEKSRIMKLDHRGRREKSASNKCSPFRIRGKGRRFAQ